MPAKVTSIEYDPNRTSDVALLVYPNGIKNYILAPQGLKVNDTVVSSEAADKIVEMGAAKKIINSYVKITSE